MTFEEILVLQYAITHLTSHKKGEIRGFSAVHPFYTSTVKTEISNLNDCIICQDWLRTIITLIHTLNTFYLFWSCILFIPNTSSSPLLYSAPPTQFLRVTSESWHRWWVLAGGIGVPFVTTLHPSDCSSLKSLQRLFALSPYDIWYLGNRLDVQDTCIRIWLFDPW